MTVVGSISESYLLFENTKKYFFFFVYDNYKNTKYKIDTEGKNPFKNPELRRNHNNNIIMKGLCVIHIVGEKKTMRRLTVRPILITVFCFRCFAVDRYYYNILFPPDYYNAGFIEARVVKLSILAWMLLFIWKQLVRCTRQKLVNDGRSVYLLCTIDGTHATDLPQSKANFSKAFYRNWDFSFLFIYSFIYFLYHALSKVYRF